MFLTVDVREIQRRESNKAPPPRRKNLSWDHGLKAVDRHAEVSVRMAVGNLFLRKSLPQEDLSEVLIRARSQIDLRRCSQGGALCTSLIHSVRSDGEKASRGRIASPSRLAVTAAPRAAILLTRHVRHFFCSCAPLHELLLCGRSVRS